MKRKKEHNIGTFISLYLNYIFQKSTIIILSISLILIVSSLIIISNPWINTNDYLYSSNDIHNNYFNQAIFILSIFNGIIICAIIITLGINSNNFDILFISSTPRVVICISKVLAIFLFSLVLVLFESIVMYLIPIISYSNYNASLNDLNAMASILLVVFLEAITSICLTTILNNVFVPMVYLFLSIVIKIICNNSLDAAKAIENIIPILKVEDTEIICNSLYLAPLWSILFLLLYISIYNVKDIKY